ncbi:MAG: EscU/YscU/HrcU family type III secretion system export apparatus switch protein, partial [Treponema sp.]|nr:EscU/YscU/HrcU family type III secretion system export apparatus switch protein [Treponema sp.]
MSREQRTENREQRAENREQLNSLLLAPCSLLPIIDLQWFSDDDDEDAPGKNLEPTETKLRKLREEGQVAKSQELVGALGLFFPAIV